jgi:hypothetical protein
MVSAFDTVGYGKIYFVKYSKQMGYGQNPVNMGLMNRDLR